MNNASNEGIDVDDTTSTSLSDWLLRWDLQALEQHLMREGIKSVQDFKYIKSRAHFTALISRLREHSDSNNNNNADDVDDADTDSTNAMDKNNTNTSTNSHSISFMDQLKLEDAWLAIVPNPEKPQATIHFLGENEKAILNELHEKCEQVMEDITVVKDAFADFNQSVFECKGQLNANMDQIIQNVSSHRQHLLQQMDEMENLNTKAFHLKLEQLQSIHHIYLLNKEKFTEIALSDDFAPSQRLLQFKKLLILQPQKQTNNENTNNSNNNNNNVNIDPSTEIDIDMKCDSTDFVANSNSNSIPGRIILSFDEQSIANAMQHNIQVNCDAIQPEWKFCQLFSKSIDFVFDDFESKYVSVTKEGTRITGIAGCAYTMISSKTALFNANERHRHQKRIIEWKIKFTKSNASHATWDGMYGIITDTANLSKVNRSHGKYSHGYVYVCDNSARKIRGYNNGTVLVDHGIKDGGKHFKVNDVITIILNCQKWTVTFIRNGNADTPIGTVDIQPEQTYYPCLLTCACKTQQFQLIK